MVRHGRLTSFGHLKSKRRNEWVLACRNVVVVGRRKEAGAVRGRKCVNDDTGGAWFAA